MQSLTQCTSTFSMNNSDLCQVSKTGIINIFIKLCDRFINCHTHYINFRTDGSGFVDRSTSTVAAFISLVFTFDIFCSLCDLKIFDINKRTHHTHLNI